MGALKPQKTQSIMIYSCGDYVVSTVLRTIHLKAAPILYSSERFLISAVYIKIPKRMSKTVTCGWCRRKKEYNVILEYTTTI